MSVNLTPIADIQQLNPIDGSVLLFQTTPYSDYEIDTVTVSSGGTGYAVNDTLTITGESGDTDAVVTVATITGGGVIATVTITNRGDFAKSTGQSVTATSGSGSGASLTITTRAKTKGTGFGQRTYKTTKAVNGTTADSNTGGNILPVQPIFTESAMSVEGSKIAIQNMKKNPTPNRPAQGMLRVANGFQCILTDQDVEAILRNVAQDKNPTVTYRGGGSKPAVHTIVASTSLGTQATPVTHTIVMVPTTYKFPVRLKATLSSTPALSTGATVGTVTISGKDRNGNTMSDVLQWTTAQLSTTLERETLRYFDPEESITVVSKGFSAGNVAVTMDDTSKQMTITPENIISDFLSFEQDVGGSVPYAFMDSIIHEIEWGIAQEAIVANCGVLSAFGQIRQNINGGTTPTALPSDVTRTRANPFTGPEGYLEIDGDRVAMENLTVSIQNGFDLPFYHDYSLWPSGRPRRVALRMVRINATLPFDAVQDFESNYLENRKIDSIKAICAQGSVGTIGAYDSSIALEIVKGFQMEMPSPQGSGVTPLTQNVVIEAYTDASEDDYTLTLIQPNQSFNLYHHN